MFFKYICILGQYIKVATSGITWKTGIESKFEDSILCIENRTVKNPLFGFLKCFDVYLSCSPTTPFNIYKKLFLFRLKKSLMKYFFFLFLFLEGGKTYHSSIC
jgi:hypothetical protein